MLCSSCLSLCTQITKQFRLLIMVGYLTFRLCSGRITFSSVQDKTLQKRICIAVPETPKSKPLSTRRFIFGTMPLWQRGCQSLKTENAKEHPYSLHDRYFIHKPCRTGQHAVTQNIHATVALFSIHKPSH